MGSLNKCSFIGNAARDAEVRSTSSGMPVANVSIACNYRAGGEAMVEWVNLVFFDKLADVAGEYITKGKQIYVEGRMQTRKYGDKEGNERQSTEIVVSNLVLLGGGESGGRDDDRGGSRGRDEGRGRDRDDRGGRDDPPPRRQQTHGEQRAERGRDYREDRGAERSPPPRREPPRREQTRSQTGFDDMDDDIPF